MHGSSQARGPQRTHSEGTARFYFDSCFGGGKVPHLSRLSDRSVVYSQAKFDARCSGFRITELAADIAMAHHVQL
jgi:hypothetical protein